MDLHLVVLMVEVTMGLSFKWLMEKFVGLIYSGEAFIKVLVLIVDVELVLFKFVFFSFKEFV